jgi:hypothetical protein
VSGWLLVLRDRARKSRDTFRLVAAFGFHAGDERGVVEFDVICIHHYCCVTQEMWRVTVHVIVPLLPLLFPCLPWVRLVSR